MIIASVVLIAGAIVFLTLGILDGFLGFLVMSIASSLLATVALVVRGRHTVARATVARPDTDASSVRKRLSAPTNGRASIVGTPVHDGDNDIEHHVSAIAVVDVSITHGDRREVFSDEPEYVREDHEDVTSGDEPSVQVTSAADTARVARLSFDVYVIDGRPRYHLSSCVHLLGRSSEPLPVREAIELGFTPCGLCEPNGTLLGNGSTRHTTDGDEN